MWNMSNAHKTLTGVPGQKTEGTFSAFWMRWWASQGAIIMENSMRKQVELDIERANIENMKRVEAHPMKPVQSTNIVAAKSRSQSLAKRLFGVFMDDSGFYR